MMERYFYASIVIRIDFKVRDVYIRLLYHAFFRLS